MAAGQAKHLPGPVAIVDASGRLRSNDLWEGNKQIATTFRKARSRLLNCGNHRPYIEEKTPTRWKWRNFVPTPADIYLTASELEFGQKHKDKIILEPNIKAIGHRNKEWFWDRWQELSYRYPGMFVQVGWGDARRLKDVEFIPTHAIRLAAAVMKYSLAYVGPEGGLHHMAAAFGRPAVVLFGQFISPEVTGYASHYNLYNGQRLGCGMRVDCQACRQGMSHISVDEVSEQLQSIIGGRGMADTPNAFRLRQPPKLMKEER